MILAPDNLPVHLPSHSSTNLLLHTTLPFTTNPVPTLVDSSATNNFIDESLAALAPHPLRHLPAPIPLKLFDGDPTPQELRLLITKLHPSAPIVLGFSWLCFTNPHVDWPSLTLCLDQDNPTDSRLVPFNVSPSSENSEATIDHPQTPPQLHSRSTRGTSGIFVSNQFSLWHNDLDRPLKLQLFDGSPATTRIMQYHNNILTLDNNLQFQAQLLVTQLPLLTPIMLGLLSEASLAATICLRLQSILDSNGSHLGASTSGATQNPSTSDDNPNDEGDATPPWSPSITLQRLPPNMPQN
ncbi:hypothetical protein E4T56_gene3624 [Termitomyces sp. T112]|nr:hypothetical protein E4T56_gene3624 [Termitomyces sp. T112]